MNSYNIYQNIDTGALMSANDYNCLSDTQKERMRIKNNRIGVYKDYSRNKFTSLSVSNSCWIKAEIYNVQPKNDMQCGVEKNNI